MQMIETSTPPEEIIEALADLKHDLGKYLRMPLAMLPADASDAEVREAIRAAVFETRKTPKGVRGASDIWEAFLDEARGSISEYAGFAALDEAVGAALAWGDADRSPDRELAGADMARVSEAIQRLIEEVADEDR